jgi:hypothetical protein
MEHQEYRDRQYASKEPAATFRGVVRFHDYVGVYNTGTAYHMGASAGIGLTQLDQSVSGAPSALVMRLPREF